MKQLILAGLCVVFAIGCSKPPTYIVEGIVLDRGGDKNKAASAAPDAYKLEKNEVVQIELYPVLEGGALGPVPFATQIFERGDDSKDTKKERGVFEFRGIDGKGIPAREYQVRITSTKIKAGQPEITELMAKGKIVVTPEDTKFLILLSSNEIRKLSK